MRYYDILITDPNTGSTVRQYTSYKNGKSDPNALLVEMDLPVAPFNTPYGNAFVRVWGITRNDISQATDLNGKRIAVSGGMQKGLPLANPAQSGVLVQGVIQQAFGNWIGVDMTLDIVISTGTGSSLAPRNIVLDWKAGTPLSQAIASMLSAAFPGYQQQINIDSRLILASDDPGYYESMEQFAAYINGLSKSIIGGTYGGVSIYLREKTFFVYDAPDSTKPHQLQYQDMIGQPTWKNPGQIQVTLVMRADLSINDYVKLPPSIITTTATALPAYRKKSIFDGAYQVAAIRHVGNSRQPDKESWVTVIDLNLIA
ncbi:hypothetical protein [Herbaspirillum huttiense]|uniref:hypothetical protein n=1 Tax=Herbaspirillum huttiense TaxID=863372 RepID=UPI0031D994B5